MSIQDALKKAQQERARRRHEDAAAPAAPAPSTPLQAALEQARRRTPPAEPASEIAPETAPEAAPETASETTPELSALAEAPLTLPSVRHGQRAELQAPSASPASGVPAYPANRPSPAPTPQLSREPRPISSALALAAPPASPAASAAPIESKAVATPLVAAVQSAAATLSPAREAAERHTQTIVEDYESKRRLNLPPEIVVYHDRSGPIADEFRHIRNKLLADRAGPRLIILTSAVAGEGKTTTALNLGLSLVELRSTRVILIDADLVRSTLTRHLHLAGRPGLADLLRAPRPAGAPLEEALCPTPWRNLFILPSGPTQTAGQATELFRRPAARTLFRQFRNLADVTLVDTPAILQTPDAGLIAAGSDSVLLTTRLHGAPQPVIQRAIRLLESLSLPVKGTILTHAK